jgi:hypothetical protein
MSEAVNPYAAPTARVDDISANPEAEAIRREHINHEASIKAIGFLYYLGGVGLTIGGVGQIMLANTGAVHPAMALLFLALGIAQFFAGWGVRGLRSWGRVIGCVISGIGLLGFPVGTLVNGYILYLFLSKKGRTVFSPEYKDVIAATPHVKYRTSILVWIFLGIIVVLIGFAMFGAFMSK